MILKARKKPVEIEAMIFTYPPSKEFSDWLGDALEKTEKARCVDAIGWAVIGTLEDGDDETAQVKHIATEGDYIIKGIAGEFYPCKPDIFKATYDIL